MTGAWIFSLARVVLGLVTLFYAWVSGSWAVEAERTQQRVPSRPSSKPGSGKTELFVQYCAYAIANRLRVLILCPTGQLVASYRQRLPESDFVRVDTIHAGMHIYRGEESLVEHAPPSTLRLYDCILIDECSQLDNDGAKKVMYA